MRSRSLVSSSNRALPSCPDFKGEGDTHVERCVGLHACKLQRYCQGMLCFEVGDGFDVLVQARSFPKAPNFEYPSSLDPIPSSCSLLPLLLSPDPPFSCICLRYPQYPSFSIPVLFSFPLAFEFPLSVSLTACDLASFAQPVLPAVC